MNEWQRSSVDRKFEQELCGKTRKKKRGRINSQSRVGLYSSILNGYACADRVVGAGTKLDRDGSKLESEVAEGAF